VVNPDSTTDMEIISNERYRGIEYFPHVVSSRSNLLACKTIKRKGKVLKHCGFTLVSGHWQDSF
jgi:hypothetical protein